MRRQMVAELHEVWVQRFKDFSHNMDPKSKANFQIWCLSFETVIGSKLAEGLGLTERLALLYLMDDSRNFHVLTKPVFDPYRDSRI